MEVTDKVVSSFDKINAYGILVRVDGKIAGFCIVTKKMGQAVYQFKHAINRIKGINEYMLRECYERYLQGVDFINYTEEPPARARAWASAWAATSTWWKRTRRPTPSRWEITPISSAAA